MTEEPDPSTLEFLRRDAFEELGRVAMLAEDYALKLFDATEQRNPMAVAGRLQQLRFCTLAMIQTFNLFLRAPLNGNHQDVASEAGRRAGDVPPVKAGDGMGGH